MWVTVNGQNKVFKFKQEQSRDARAIERCKSTRRMHRLEDEMRQRMR